MAMNYTIVCGTFPPDRERERNVRRMYGLTTESIEISYLDFGKLYWKVDVDFEHPKPEGGQYEHRAHKYCVLEFPKLSIATTGPINLLVTPFGVCVCDWNCKTLRVIARAQSHFLLWFSFLVVDAHNVQISDYNASQRTWYARDQVQQEHFRRMPIPIPASMCLCDYLK